MSLRIAIGPSSFADADDTPLRMLEEAGVEVVPNPFGRRLTEDEIIEHLRGIDGLIAGLEPLNRNVISSAAPRFKAIARVGIGMNNVDFKAAEEFNVKVSNTPAGPTQAVMEMTLAALLSLCRRLQSASSSLHKGEWKKEIGMGLAGTKVLIIGYGRIGRCVGETLTFFGSEVLVADPFIDAGTLVNGERLVGLEDGLREAEVISLHASGSDQILNKAQFDVMRDGVILLNSARGELVDENALVAALDSGKVGGAWFDAFKKEPYEGPLKKYEQVLLSPHIATYTHQCRLSMESSAVENLLRDLGVK